MKIRLAEKSKYENHCDMYWKLCDVVKLMLKREGFSPQVIHHHGNWVKGDMTSNMIMMSFLNGRNPVHMYIRIGTDEPFYIRANTFTQCVSNCVKALRSIRERYEPIQDTILCTKPDNSNSVEAIEPRPVSDIERIFYPNKES